MGYGGGDAFAAFMAPGHLEAPATSADVAKRCTNCNSDLSANDLDLKSVKRFVGTAAAENHWDEGAEAGCMFCRLITAVKDHARQQDGRGQFDMRLGPNLDGQYHLSLSIWSMTGLPHTLSSEIWATVTVFLKGKVSSVNRYVSRYQRHRYPSPHPPGKV